jgi:hypothetical protein
MKHAQVFFSLATLMSFLFVAGCENRDLGSLSGTDCPESDTSATVVLRGCDTTVANKQVGECTLADVLKECEPAVGEEFARCIAGKTNALMDQNVITGKDKGNIQICAGDDRETEGEQPGEE